MKLISIIGIRLRVSPIRKVIYDEDRIYWSWESRFFPGKILSDAWTTDVWIL